MAKRDAVMKKPKDTKGTLLRLLGYMKEFKISSNKTSAYAYSMQSYMNNRSVYCVLQVPCWLFPDPSGQGKPLMRQQPVREK